LGRSIIIPDDIAVRALADGPFVVVRLYNDGERVSDDPGQVLVRIMEIEVKESSAMIPVHLARHQACLAHADTLLCKLALAATDQGAGRAGFTFPLFVFYK
jgi:hypothetical protein